MQLTIAELPKVCSLSNAEVLRRIHAAHETLLATRRPEAYRKLSRREWAREKAQMRFWLGVWIELLDLRQHFARLEAKRTEQPLPEPVSGFDSDLLTPAEIETVQRGAMVTANQIPASGLPDANYYLTLDLLTTICEERRRG